MLYMAKKYFIRKSHAELVQEQNQLLEILLAKHEEKLTNPQIVYAEKSVVKDVVDDTVDDFIVEEDIFEFEDDFPYIPPTAKSSANLFVTTNQIELDDDNVEKLKNKRKNKSNS